MDIKAFTQTLEAMQPPPNLTVSQWADRYRKLSPEASAEPGQWRTDKAPYQRGILDAYNDPVIETIVVMSSAQVGKTELINNIVGYAIDQNPGPMLLLNPTLEMSKTWSKDRLAPMARDTEVLRGKIKDPRSRDTGNTMLHKTFPGGHITMAGANSPASLASRPIRDVLCDEVDRYPVSAGTEGDPVNLAKKRSTTFWNRKMILTSTPTVKGASRIEMAYEASDKRRYYVSCPHCDEKQHLKWSQIVFDKENPKDVVYACEHCGSQIEEKDKFALLTKGEWIAENPTVKTAGFHLNELYSPWRKWSEVVADFLEAKKNPETLKTWVNTSLGETWEEEGESVNEAGLLARREAYSSDELPEGVLCLVSAADVQQDRIEMEVVGYGKDDESWGIEYRVIYGDTTQRQVWDDLDKALLKTYQHSSGAVLPISAACIDSGYRTDEVYDFCKYKTERRIFPTKGVAGEGRPIVSAPSKKRTGKEKKPVKLFTVGADTAKGLVYSSLRISEPGPGYCHFPTTYTQEYFEQLTAEKVVTKFHKGFPRREWIKTRPRNEALDIRGMALAALRLLNPVYSQLKKSLSPAPKPAIKPQHQSSASRDSWVGDTGDWFS